VFGVGAELGKEAGSIKSTRFAMGRSFAARYDREDDTEYTTVCSEFMRGEKSLKLSTPCVSGVETSKGASGDSGCGKDCEGDSASCRVEA
jgi:hypothetical protein